MSARRLPREGALDALLVGLPPHVAAAVRRAFIAHGGDASVWDRSALAAAIGALFDVEGDVQRRSGGQPATAPTLEILRRRRLALLEAVGQAPRPVLVDEGGDAA